MFFNQDAQEHFLPPKTVDLFLTHPPYINTHAKEYGGNNQIQDTFDVELFYNRMMNVIKHMESALKDDGNILLLVPNDIIGPQFASRIPHETQLRILEILVWDFQDSHFEIEYSPTVLIYRFAKSEDAYKTGNIKHNVIRLPWDTSNLMGYATIGFINDALSEELADILISEFSGFGDTVADLMAGTGTVPLMARRLGRNFIYNDISEEQMRIAQKRMRLV